MVIHNYTRDKRRLCQVIVQFSLKQLHGISLELTPIFLIQFPLALPDVDKARRDTSDHAITAWTRLRCIQPFRRRLLKQSHRCCGNAKPIWVRADYSRRRVLPGKVDAYGCSKAVLPGLGSGFILGARRKHRINPRKVSSKPQGVHL
jgi:hypothetical protein